MTKSVARTITGPDQQLTPPWRLASAATDRLESTMLDVVAELAGDLLPAVGRSVRHGGKRLRPALVLAVATSRRPGAFHDGDVLPDADAGMRAAAAVELLHHATLVHDDLLDDAELRHGAETVNVADGAARALLTGDMLIAAAHVLAARSGRTSALVMAHTLADLCRGEALQARQRFDADLTSPQMLAVARLKAGSLLRAAAVLGGEVAGYGTATLDALGRFGAEFGVALQLVDDLLDVLADADTVGKPVGVDFAGGTVTLPAIVAMQRHPELRALLRPEPDETSRHRALRLLRCHVAVRATREAAHEHAELAARALAEVAGGEPGLHELATWPEQYVSRQLRAMPDTARDGCCAALVAG